MTDIITIRMDHQDFMMLCDNSLAWAGHGWPDKHPIRFVPIDDSKEVNWNFAHAYWIDTWAETLMARAFLEAHGQEFQILIDEGVSKIVIVTDYVTPE